MKEHWKLREIDIEDRSDISGYEHLPQEIVQLFRNRDLRDKEAIDAFLSPEYEKHLHDPFLFQEMQSVIDRFLKAQKKKETIGVYGDFDADGVTGSALFREALEGLGFDVIVYIPEKEKEGHGISTQGIDHFNDQNVTLMCSVDCGVSDIDSVAYANARGIDTIIIDHHHTPEVLPDAIAVINPKLESCTYPFKDLCGAGTAFKVSQALYSRLAPEKSDQLKWLLDLAAIGTVADCMPLVGENRVLVKYGLVVLSKTRRPGLKHMFEIGRIRCNAETPPTSVTIGFQIGPRINAAGRMAHAKTAHDMLLENDERKAFDLSQTLEKYNKERQQISEKFTRKALKEVKEKHAEKHFILSVANDYPLGIVGLIAGRLSNELNKPAAVLRQEKDISRGSFRSVDGVNIISLIEQCQDILEGYGGHAQAAGITIQNRHVKTFYEKLNALVSKCRKETEIDAVLDIDAEIQPEFLTFEIVDMLKQFEPFGEGNAEPAWLIRDLEVTESRFVGTNNAHLKLTLSHDGRAKKTYYEAIGFSMGTKFFELKQGDRVDVVGHIQENVWNGKRSLQIQLVDIAVHSQDIAQKKKDRVNI